MPFFFPSLLSFPLSFPLLSFPLSSFSPTTVDALNKLDSEYAAAEEEAEKLAKERQNKLKEERERMKEEMNKLEEEQNDEHSKVADWAASWDPMAFASEEEREEAEIRHEIKTEEMKIRAAEEKKKNDERKRILLLEMEEKEEKLKIQLAKEGVERKKKEDKARELAEAKARWEADQAREEQRTKSRERRSRQREDKLNAARAGAFVFIGLLFWLKWLCVLPCDLAL